MIPNSYEINQYLKPLCLRMSIIGKQSKGKVCFSNESCSQKEKERKEGSKTILNVEICEEPLASSEKDEVTFYLVEGSSVRRRT